jgi:imidazolonepropionase-like amidohydrolase
MAALLLKNCLVIDTENKKDFIKDILIENGKIKRISEKAIDETDDMKVVDVRERYVIPGFIDCHTHLGIIEEATGKIGVDNNETSDPVTPELRAIDAVNPFDIAFMDAVKCGITTVMTGPGSNNAVGGQNIVVKTAGNIIDDMVVKSPSGLKIALGENPLSTYGVNKKCPVTRMGTAALIRELFMKAQDYMVQKEQGKIKERDIKLEAVVPLLQGKIILRAHAHRADDIVTAVRIADEFNIKNIVIEHGTEANLVKEFLKQKNIPVAMGPMLSPRIKMELKRRHYSSTYELIEAGIKVAIITDHPFNSIDQLRSVMLLATAEGGLDPYDGLKCLTANPADILQCGDRIGKLEEGYDADLTIFSVSPLELNSKIDITIINGRIVYSRDGTEIKSKSK